MGDPLKRTDGPANFGDDRNDIEGRDNSDTATDRSRNRELLISLAKRYATEGGTKNTDNS